MILSILLVVFAILVILNIPIAFAIGMASLAALLYKGGLPLTLVAQRMGTGADSFPLMAIPFFILAGNLMDTGGIARRLIDFANALVGWVRGGLGMVTIIAEMFLSGITGSSVADAAALGSVVIPAMRKKGFDEDFSAAILAGTSVLGIIIPPSIPMVVYGVIAGVSVGDLFLGGAIPGIVVALALMGLTYHMASRYPERFPREHFAGWRELVKKTRDGIPALLMPLIILGGIVGGVVTPTEAAVVAVLYAYLVGTLYYKELKPHHLSHVALETVVGTAVVMYLVATASLFGWLLAFEQIPQKVAELFFSVSTNPLVILLLVNILLLFVGTFMDLTAALIILGPVLVPMAMKVGIDPVHFGVMMIVNLGIGLVTPPVGVCLFITCNIAKISLGRLSRAMWPVLAMLILALFVVAYVPETVTFLPKLFAK